MQNSAIYITDRDMQRLRARLSEYQRSGDRDAAHIKDLTRELDRAIVVEAPEIPSDVITLRSQATLRDLDNSEESTYTLVYPEESDPSNGRISVLSPIGTAMLGYRSGAVFEWKVPKGTRRMEVLKVVYQPEASGEFYL